MESAGDVQTNGGQECGVSHARATPAGGMAVSGAVHATVQAPSTVDIQTSGQAYVSSAPVLLC